MAENALTPLQNLSVNMNIKIVNAVKNQNAMLWILIGIQHPNKPIKATSNEAHAPIIYGTILNFFIICFLLLKFSKMIIAQEIELYNSISKSNTIFLSE